MKTYRDGARRRMVRLVKRAVWMFPAVALVVGGGVAPAAAVTHHTETRAAQCAPVPRHVNPQFRTRFKHLERKTAKQFGLVQPSYRWLGHIGTASGHKGAKVPLRFEVQNHSGHVLHLASGRRVPACSFVTFRDYSGMLRVASKPHSGYRWSYGPVSD